MSEETKTESEQPTEDVKAEKSAAETLYPEKKAESEVKAEDKESDSKGADEKASADDEKKESDSKDDDKESKDGKEDESKDKDKSDENIEVKLPEQSPLGDDEVEEVKAFAKEHGLSSKQAQAILDYRHDAVVGAAQNLMAEAETKKNAWADEVRNDPDLGGQNFDETLKVSKAVIDKYGSDKLKGALNESGLGNFPELVRMLKQIGHDLKITNDKFESGSGPGSNEVSREKVLYPNMK